MNKLNKYVKLSSIIIFILCSVNVEAQQDPVYTQYLNNLLTVQPAYAGIQGNLNLTALSHAQWVGWEGAPNTNTLICQFPLKTYNVGLGATFINDKWGPIRQNSLYFDYAYRVQTSQRVYLSFGIKAGFNVYQARLTDLDKTDVNDNTFSTDINFKFMPNVGLGLMWHSDRFFVGVSSPKILKNNITDEASGSVYREVTHIYAMGGYVFFLSNAAKLKPTILYRWSENTPSFFDASLNLLLYDKIWVGATYRYNNSVGMMLQYRLNTQLTFGYAYDLTTFRQSQINAGTHEFLISYDFVSTRRGQSASPKYF